MKLALCLEYPIDQSGGTEVLVAELVKGLGQRYEIILVSPDTEATLQKSAVREFIRQQIHWDPVKVTVQRARELAAKLAAAKIDLAHFHFGGNYSWNNRAFGACPVVQLKRYKIPCLSTNHGAFSILEGYCWHLRPIWVKLALFFPAWLSKQYVLAHIQTEIAVSKHDYHALRRWYWPMRDKFQFLYHSRLQSAPPAFKPDRQKVILCAGTIGPRKGQIFLVAAFARLASRFPEWDLVLIGRNGDDGMMGEIRQIITTHKLEKRIQLLGRRTDDELNVWLQAAAIFAMPSLHEGLGLSLQEAQFYGCACVASAAGGVVDLVQDGDNGLLVPVGQVEPLADALERLMADPALRDRLSRRAPQSVLEKKMTAPQMVAAYEQIYANYLSQTV